MKKVLTKAKKSTSSDLDPALLNSMMGKYMSKTKSLESMVTSKAKDKGSLKVKGK